MSAVGRIVQEIVVKVTGTDDAKQAEKVVKELDGKKAKVEVDVDASKAKSGLAGIKQDIADADGVVGKAKAGVGGLADAIGTSLGGAAAAGAGANGAFGIKANDAFVNLAKSAKDLGTATGESTEEASRWIAVADDFQVSASDLQSALGKTLKSLDSGPWDKFGIATRDSGGKVRDTSDILVDALSTISKMSTEQERAAAGTELFGKGWASIAPLVGHTKDEYQQMLKTVSDGQVITSKESATAERMRLAQDSLHDALQDVTLAVGQFTASLSPMIEEAAGGVEEISKLVDILNKIPGGSTAFIAAFEAQTNPIKTFNTAVSAATDTIDASHASMEQWRKGAEGLTGEDLTKWWKAWTDAHPDEDIKRVDRSQQDWLDTINSGNSVVENQNAVLGRQAGALKASGDAANLLGEQQQILNDATKAAVEASQAYADSLGKQADAMFGLGDAERAASKAEEDFAAAAKTTTEETKKHGAGSEEAAAAVEHETDAAIAAAKAQEELADQHAKAAGKTQTNVD